MNKFKKDDLIEILVGKDKGKQGKILKVFPEKQHILVEKINLYKKAIKPSNESKGGIIDVPIAFNWSKAALVGPGKKRIKVKFETKKGKKNRVIKGTGDIL
ncbi:50S ribosomal protein L24 [Candidatus Marinamargulisbacteria bacterium SCGC AAA071-K20]|nr:50S ribosomal protein L24 [Candidatus Marinamargulisbacteria bacterium SCGC AAA071-K20]